MADYEAKIAPFINETFYVTSEWWEQPRNHRGLDIATPSSLGNVALYSMCNGEIVHKAYDEDGYGYYIIMKDYETGMGFLYAHLNEPSMLNVGESVQIGQIVGYEGTTGSSTGIHLHIEMQDLTSHSWIFGADKSYYSNPAEFMGFPNVEGISVIYYGVPLPPEPPTPTIRRKNHFNWVLYTNKLRNKRLLS